MQGSFINVSDLHVTSTNLGYGMLIQDGTQGNTISNCEITGAGAGIVVLGTGHRIYNNYIHDLTMMRSTDDDDNDNDDDDDYGAVGIWLNEPVSTITIYKNRFVNCMAPSLDYGTDGGVLEAWGTVTDIEFYANYSEGNNGFFEAGSSSNASISNILIHHNISINDVALFVPHSSGKFSIIFSNISYVNNTVYCDIDYDAAFFNMHGTNVNETMLHITNNIFINRNPIYDLVDAGFTHTGNLYYWPLNASAVTIGITIDETEITDTDPLLSTISASGYTLDPSSSAINNGSSTSFILDYLENTIPYNLEYDIGAIEFQE